MFGLTRVTFLFNLILIAFGNFIRLEKLLNKNLINDESSSNYFDNKIKSNFDVWRPISNKQYYPRTYERKNPTDAFKKMDQHDPTHWQKCQYIKGLPKPESGCCGVELPKFPVQRNQKCPPVPKWLITAYPRLRRSTGSHIPPTKMILGTAIEPQRLPWMVRLTIKALETPQLHGVSECSGTIISSRYVLTAAHCLDHYKELSQLEVILAEYDINTYKYDRFNSNKCIENIAMTVEHVIIHEDYNITYLQNDVALLRLSSIIPFTEFIKPICLPESDVAHLQDKTFIIGGWGHDRQSHLKQAAFVNYVTNNKCVEQYSYKDDSLFCVIGDHGEDVCHGDSGGPLMVYMNNTRTYFLSGVVSGKRGDYACGSKDPSLFNNVFYHKDWIIKHAI